MLTTWSLEILLSCVGLLPIALILSVMLLTPALQSGASMFILISICILCSVAAYFLLNTLRNSGTSLKNTPLKQDLEAADDIPPKYEEVVALGSQFKIPIMQDENQTFAEMPCKPCQEATGLLSFAADLPREEASSNPPSYEEVMGLNDASIKG